MRSFPGDFGMQREILIPPDAIEFTGKSALRRCQSAQLGTFNPLDPNGTNLISIEAASIQHAAVADTLVMAASAWEVAIGDALPAHGHGAPPSDEQTAAHTVVTDYYQPYAVSLCVRDMIEGRDDPRSVQFPFSSAMYDAIPDNLKNSTSAILGVPVIEYSPLKRAQLLNYSGSESSYRAKWIDFPDSLLSAPALGAVILLPDGYTSVLNGSVQDYVVCTLQAGWGSSSINTTTVRAAATATSSLTSLDLFTQSLPSSSPDKDSRGFFNRYQVQDDVPVYYTLPLFPNKLVSIKADWPEFLNPTLGSLNTMVMDYALSTLLGKGNTSSPKWGIQPFLSALLANCLGRVGYDFQFQGSPRIANGSDGTPELDGTFWASGKGDFFTVDPDESKDWVKLQVDSTIEGYAYNTRGTSPKLAIAFLLTYCLLAIGYTLYSGISGKSSDVLG